MELTFDYNKLVQELRSHLQWKFENYLKWDLKDRVFTIDHKEVQQVLYSKGLPPQMYELFIENLYPTAFTRDDGRTLTVKYQFFWKDIHNILQEYWQP